MCDLYNTIQANAFESKAKLRMTDTCKLTKPLTLDSHSDILIQNLTMHKQLKIITQRYEGAITSKSNGNITLDTPIFIVALYKSDNADSNDQITGEN